MRPTTIVLSANYTMVFEWCVGTQSCVYHTNRKGLSTQPCRKPMLSDRVDDIWDPTHSICGWSVKKLKIQLQIWVEKPRSVSLQ